MSTAAVSTQPRSTDVSSFRPKHSLIARWWWAIRVFTRFVAGYLGYIRTGGNTPGAYADMRRLFRMSRGKFNDAFGIISGVFRRPYRIGITNGILGYDSAHDIKTTVEGLRRDGAFVFGQVLGTNECAELVRWAESIPCRPMPLPESCDPYVHYDRDHWIAPKYAFDESAILAHPIAQRLAADENMLAVAQGYLGAKPVLSSCVMWWSTAMLAHASSEAAQLYHFDMSHIRFVKFFFYLTDVGPDNGPHTYVRQSHRRLHPSLVEDRRFTDAEVLACHPKEQVLQITGPAGTLFAADTRGLHKGMPLKCDDRLVLEFQFATCHFGDSPGPVTIDNAIPALREAANRFPRAYARLELKKQN